MHVVAATAILENATLQISDRSFRGLQTFSWKFLLAILSGTFVGSPMHCGTDLEAFCLMQSAVIPEIVICVYLDPPEFDTYQSLSVVRACSGSSASLRCTAVSVPASKFTWLNPRGEE